MNPNYIIYGLIQDGAYVAVGRFTVGRSNEFSVAQRDFPDATPIILEEYFEEDPVPSLATRTQAYRRLMSQLADPNFTHKFLKPIYAPFKPEYVIHVPTAVMIQDCGTSKRRRKPARFVSQHFEKDRNGHVKFERSYREGFFTWEQALQIVQDISKNT